MKSPQLASYAEAVLACDSTRACTGFTFESNETKPTTPVKVQHQPRGAWHGSVAWLGAPLYSYSYSYSCSYCKASSSLCSVCRANDSDLPAPPPHPASGIFQGRAFRERRRGLGAWQHRAVIYCHKDSAPVTACHTVLAPARWVYHTRDAALLRRLANLLCRLVLHRLPCLVETCMCTGLIRQG